MTKIIVAFLVLVAACYGGKLQIPGEGLKAFHNGCTSNKLSRSSHCVASMHRFCNKIVFPSPHMKPPQSQLVGISRETMNNRIGVSCVPTKSIANVNVNVLKNKCTTRFSQAPQCMIGIHRFCQKKFGKDFVGISQEIPNKNDLTTSCFKSSKKQLVPIKQLRMRNHGCKNIGQWYTDHCFSAASRWCIDQGFSGGITQEASKGKVLVACYISMYSGDVPIQIPTMKPAGGKPKKRGAKPAKPVKPVRPVKPGIRKKKSSKGGLIEKFVGGLKQLKQKIL